MPVSVRLARKGEELALAKLHYDAFSAPSESYRAFVSPRYAAFEEYTIGTGEKRRYAGLIEKQSVCCAVDEGEDSEVIIGVASWRLPDSDDHDGSSPKSSPEAGQKPLGAGMFDF